MIGTKIKEEKLVTNDVVKGLIVSMEDLLPNDTEVGAPSFIETSTSVQNEAGVLIALSGDFNGQFMMEGHLNSFKQLSQILFGLTVDRDMFNSFIRNLGKMIVSNMIANLLFKGIHLHSSTPTVIGEGPIYTTFDRAIQVPIQIHSHESITITIMFNDDEIL